MKYAQVIIDAGYGDSGKGLMTDYFCHQLSNTNKIVIRYNGGAQAGHNVVLPDGTKHEFHHFGAGTLQEVPTYLARDFIVNPMVYCKERNMLHSLITVPLIRIHPDCRVTTPYDMLLNQIIENSRDNRHGSCGLGIYETITRHNVIPLTVSMLYGMKLPEFNTLMNSIKSYVYDRLFNLGIELTDEYKELLELNVTDAFINDIQELLYSSVSQYYKDISSMYDVYIFESAQGLLLSEKHGVMPHLTPSDPGLEQPLAISELMGVNVVNVCYVTRSYTTRHGNGPLHNEKTAEELGLKNLNETNVTNEFQGKFRYAPLDINAITKTIHDDYQQVVNYPGVVNRQLAITCMDHLPTYADGLSKHNIAYMQHIRKKVGIYSGYYSIGPTRDNVYKSNQV